MNLNIKIFNRHINKNKISHLKDDFYMIKEDDFKKLFVDKNNKLIYNNIYVFESSTRYNNLVSEEEYIIIQLL